jgi:hypothetical protein
MGYQERRVELIAKRAVPHLEPGEPTGMYHKVEFDRAYKVHRQYYPEITAADEALRAMQAMREDRPHGGSDGA